jgi:SOS response regulatory protein OraA/RecX
MTPDQERIRANQAQQVLENPMYQEATTALKADLFRKFERTKWYQTKDRTEIWRTLKNLNNLETYLSRVVGTGKMIK